MRIKARIWIWIPLCALLITSMPALADGPWTSRSNITSLANSAIVMLVQGTTNSSLQGGTNGWMWATNLVSLTPGSGISISVTGPNSFTVSATGGGSGLTNPTPINLSITSQGTNVAVSGSTPAGCMPGATITYRFTATTNFLLQNLSGSPFDDQLYRFEIKQDATGNRLGFWDTQYTYGQTITPIVLSTNANALDVISAVWRSSENRLIVLGVAEGY